MNPLASIFGAGVRLRNALYDRGNLPVRRLQGPTISVGNLSVGGSGKTPFVLLLGELLKTRGVKFDVLSRGYGRHTQGVLRVEPGGSSRESPQAFPVDGKLVWRVRRGIVAKNVPARPVAFCGIARPQSFLLQLRTAGVQPAAEAVYRDHYIYREEDVRELLRVKTESEAEGFVTTEKDAINLGGYLSALEPLAVIPVKMELLDAANAMDTMLRMVEERRRAA